MICLIAAGIKGIMEVYSVSFDARLKEFKDTYNAILEATSPSEIIDLIKDGVLTTDTYVNVANNNQITIISSWEIDKPNLIFVRNYDTYDNTVYWELYEEGKILKEWEEKNNEESMG